MSPTFLSEKSNVIKTTQNLNYGIIDFLGGVDLTSSSVSGPPKDIPQQKYQIITFELQNTSFKIVIRICQRVLITLFTCFFNIFFYIITRFKLKNFLKRNRSRLGSTSKPHFTFGSTLPWILPLKTLSKNFISVVTSTIQTF